MRIFSTIFSKSGTRVVSGGRKKRLYILTLVLSIAAFCVQAIERPSDWAQFDRYEADNARLTSLPADSTRVVLFGNSITDSWASMRPDFFASNNLIGRGISGQSTYQFLARFRRDAVDLRPVLIVLNGATNDIAENSHPYDQEKTLGNILSMIDIARANGIKVILTSTLPAAGFKWNRSITDAPEKITALNARLRQIAQEKGIPFVDYYPLLLAPDGRSLNPAYTKDGVHPTVAGYAVMEKALLPVIRSQLAK